jgi:hypothetical protein
MLPGAKVGTDFPVQLLSFSEPDGERRLRVRLGVERPGERCVIPGVEQFPATAPGQPGPDSQPCGVSAVRMRMGISSTRLAISGRDGPPDAGRVMWRDCAAVGQQPARVVEEDDAVAQQAPPLLGVEGDGVGRVTVRAVRWRARGPVRTHGEPLGSGVADVRGLRALAGEEPGRLGDCCCEDGTSRPMASSSRSLAGGGVAGSALAWSPLRDARRAECLHNRDAEIAGSHQGGSPLVQLTVCTTSGRSRRQRARRGSLNAGTRASGSACRPRRPGCARRAGRRRVRRDPARPADASARTRSPCAPAGRGYG